jgi:hydrogenase maturation protease
MDSLWANTVSHRTENTGPSPQIVVIGFGNILLKDEGIGVHIIQKFESTARESIRKFVLIDGGTCPDILFQLPEMIVKLIVVDAVKGGGEPGSIYRFTPNDIEFKRGSITSLHQLGLLEGLRMMEFLGKYPESVVIIGIEPKEIDWGLEISPEVKVKIPQVIHLLEQEISK